jgi:hypothetical protein
MVSETIYKNCGKCSIDLFYIIECHEIIYKQFLGDPALLVTTYIVLVYCCLLCVSNVWL